MNWFDAPTLINRFGDFACVAVAVLVFLETAFLPASFLPGDSVLFLLGLSLTKSVSGPYLLAFALVLTAIGASGGSAVSFEIGSKIGQRLLANWRWKGINLAVQKANDLFTKHGLRALILARFTPIIRAIAPLISGMSGTRRAAFAKYNLIGSLVWTNSLLLGGWFLGQLAFVNAHLNQVILAIVVLTSLPFPVEVMITWLRSRRTESR